MKQMKIWYTIRKVKERNKVYHNVEQEVICECDPKHIYEQIRNHENWLVTTYQWWYDKSDIMYIIANNIKQYEYKVDWETIRVDCSATYRKRYCLERRCLVDIKL